MESTFTSSSIVDYNYDGLSAGDVKNLIFIAKNGCIQDTGSAVSLIGLQNYSRLTSSTDVG